MQPIYIGYCDLATWADQADRQAPVYAESMFIPESSDSHGGNVERAVILIAQIRAGLVHYWQQTTARLAFVGPTPMDSDHEARRAAANQAWGIVHAWLQEHGFSVVRAAIALPKDHRLVTGCADFLTYDKDAKTWRRYEATSPQ